jgi:hypothetical protein
MTVACRECRYYQTLESSQLGKPWNERGECRRKTPTGETMRDAEGRVIHIGYWPRIGETDWCGEFATRFVALHNEKRPDDSRAAPQ